LQIGDVGPRGGRQAVTATAGTSPRVAAGLAGRICGGSDACNCRLEKELWREVAQVSGRKGVEQLQGVVMKGLTVVNRRPNRGGGRSGGEVWRELAAAQVGGCKDVAASGTGRSNSAHGETLVEKFSPRRHPEHLTRVAATSCDAATPSNIRAPNRPTAELFCKTRGSGNFGKMQAVGTLALTAGRFRRAAVFGVRTVRVTGSGAVRGTAGCGSVFRRPP